MCNLSKHYFNRKTMHAQCKRLFLIFVLSTQSIIWIIFECGGKKTHILAFLHEIYIPTPNEVSVQTHGSHLRLSEHVETSF